MPVLKRSLSIDEVPDVQKEPYVLTGYRPPYRPWGFYLMSIFSQHNETVNVWTHLIPSFYVVYLLKTYSDEVSFAHDVSSMLLLLLGISNFTIQFLSACAHLLHSRSVAAYYVTFIFDFLGIAPSTLSAAGSCSTSSAARLRFPRLCIRGFRGHVSYSVVVTLQPMRTRTLGTPDIIRKGL
ncbi:membrane progestin receptor alpha-like isoform X2 [Branchiostoma floridae x Branchiostoma japonicum]